MVAALVMLRVEVGAESSNEVERVVLGLDKAVRAHLGEAYESRELNWISDTSIVVNDREER